MTRIHSITVIIVVVALTSCVALFSGNAFGAQAFSAVPSAMHYQARLASAEGLTVDNDVAVRVVLYDSPTLGSVSDLNDVHVLYAEDQGSVHVDRGMLRFSIGEGAARGPFAGSPLPLESLAVAENVFIELEINGETIAPRQKVSYHNAAVRAQYARKAHEFSGDLRLISSNIPDLPASKVSGELAQERLPDLPTSILNGAISDARIPNNVPLSRITGDIAAAVIPPIDASCVTEGRFAVSQMPATIMSLGDIAVSTGSFTGQAVLAPPAGFAVNQCAWIASVGQVEPNTMSFQMPNGIDEITVSSDPNVPHFGCSVARNNGGTVQDCQGTYLIVCAR